MKHQPNPTKITYRKPWILDLTQFSCHVSVMYKFHFLKISHVFYELEFFKRIAKKSFVNSDCLISI